MDKLEKSTVVVILVVNFSTSTYPFNINFSEKKYGGFIGRSARTSTNQIGSQRRHCGLTSTNFILLAESSY